MITSLLSRSLFSRQSSAVSLVPVPRAAAVVWLAPDSARGGGIGLFEVGGGQSLDARGLSCNFKGIP